MDSNGPASRIRGTPQQILDRYLTLARDAMSSGDSVVIESLLQHAEHYTRMLNAAAGQQQQNENAYQGGGRDDQDDDSYADRDGGDGRSMSSNDYADQSRNLSLDFDDSDVGDVDDRYNGADRTQASERQQGGERQQGNERQQGGEQPPARRRRRSRFQRQHDNGGEGAEGGSQPAHGANHNGADQATSVENAPPNAQHEPGEAATVKPEPTPERIDPPIA